MFICRSKYPGNEAGVSHHIALHNRLGFSPYKKHVPALWGVGKGGFSGEPRHMEGTVTQFPLAVLACHTELPERRYPEGITRLELLRSPPAQAAQRVCVRCSC